MAPDKIYLNRRHPEPFWFKDKQIDSDVEYIRKDIVDETIKTAEDHAYFAGQEKFREKLIEWASKMLGQVSDMGFDDGDVEHGYTRALQDIIDKINSL